MENNIDEVQLDIESAQHYETATAGQRFANHLIDMILYYLIIFLIFLFIGTIIPSFLADDEDIGVTIMTYVIIYIVVISYFTIMELMTGKTVGKMVTGTKVIREDGMKLTLRDCFIRSICRLIPFEAFSGFSSSGVMWHDSIAKTYVVKNNSLRLN